MTPMQRSRAYLEEQGYLVAVVEHFNVHARVSQDLFGFIDLVALRRDETLGVQVTSGSNVAARVKKITESPLVGRVREAGWRLSVQGWRKSAAGKWECREVDLS